WQIQTLTADQGREELVGEDRLWIGGVRGVVERQVWPRAEDAGLRGRDGVAEVVRGCAIGGKSGITERGERDLRDRRIGVANGESVDDASLTEIAPLAIAVEGRILEVGVELGEDLRDEDGVVRDVPRALVRNRNGGRFAVHLDPRRDADRV